MPHDNTAMAGGTPALVAGAPHALNYSRPGRLQSKPGLYRTAIWCAAVPMVVGTVDFLLWLLVGGETLMAVGAFTILGGLGLFAVGAGSLIAYLWRELRAGLQSGKALAKRVTLAAVLLLANFPLAFGYMAAAGEIMRTCVVVVANDSSRPVDSFTLSGPDFRRGGPVELGPIEPGGRATYKFKPDVDGGIRYDLQQGDRAVGGQVTDYAWGGTQYNVAVDDEGVKATTRQR